MSVDERIRGIALESSQVAVTNIATADHSGLVTLRMRHGIVEKVWAGTEDGLLVWEKGRTLCHILPNVEGPLVHG